METELQALIRVALSSESAMMSFFPGGIFPRLPRAGKGASATPNAFWTQAENQLESGKLKNVISVLDGGNNPAPNGVARGGYMGFPLVYAFVEPSNGSAALKALRNALKARFNRKLSYPWLDSANNVTGMEIVTLERQVIRDAEDMGYPDRWFTIWRLQATSVQLADIP